MQREIIQLKAERLRILWKDFCERHSELYDLTCDEYMHLLASDIEALEEVIDQKKALIEFINGLDDLRDELISDICGSLSINPDSKLIELITALKSNNFETQGLEIEKLNLLLLDIVEKIQEQNKKNQIFLNKALYSLNELKQSFGGQKSYKTYSSSGMAKTSHGY